MTDSPNDEHPITFEILEHNSAIISNQMPVLHKTIPFTYTRTWSLTINTIVFLDEMKLHENNLILQN